jgi:two-component system chemotaxis sensor kinase CheA
MAKVGSQVRSIGGTIGFRPERDGLNQLVISVPLSVAIIPAVMVQVAAEVYAVPLQSVAEIVRLADHPVQTIRSHWVMRLRERVVPMVDIARTIGLPSSLCAASTAGSSAVAAASTSKPQTLVGDRFAIVVHAGEHQAALVVDRVVGKQDVVIKQLEGHTSTTSTAKDDAGFFSGATIRDDGRVSLIFETARLIAAAQNDAGENLSSIS